MKMKPPHSQEKPKHAPYGIPPQNAWKTQDSPQNAHNAGQKTWNAQKKTASHHAYCYSHSQQQTYASDATNTTAPMNS
jgi:hypothetical protein